ncbi:unnamed protein product [marine sediment metagenome]|uniref:Resolvase HTH domain-containing protein n=1 Tax=marine sediment metagenome TaxID=412755 RepID=X1RFA0_9ZZZZ
MNGQVQSSRVARCRQLKKEGMTIAGISEKCHISVPTVGRYVKGIVDQREKREMQSRTVFPTILNNKVRNTRNAEQDSISHISRISQGRVTNADQDSISHISQRRGKSNIGVGVLLFLALAILILVLLDRFVLEGKILDWFFGQLKLQDHSEVTEQKVDLIGFEGRSLNDI